MNVGAAIFDMDGLLVDTEPHWHAAKIRLAERRGVPFAEAGFSETIGMRIDQSVAVYKNKFGWKEPVSELVIEWLSLVRPLFHSSLQMMPGARRLLDHFRDSGIPCALASGSPHELIGVVLDRFDLRPSFRAVVSSWDVRNGKPAPDIFLETARRLAELPEKCVVFEDATNGIKAAKAAGMTAVMVPGRSRLDDGGLADLKLSRLDEFLDHHQAAHV